MALLMAERIPPVQSPLPGTFPLMPTADPFNMVFRGPASALGLAFIEE